MPFNCYMPPEGHNWGECEPCDDCVSRGLEDIRIELHKIDETLKIKKDLEGKIKALQNYIQTVEQISQPRLQSGMNIKTINGNDVLGSGNMVVGGGGGSPDWNDITNKPSTFPASPHTHDFDSITDKPETYAPSPHNHDDRYETRILIWENPDISQDFELNFIKATGDFSNATHIEIEYIGFKKEAGHVTNPIIQRIAKMPEHSSSSASAFYLTSFNYPPQEVKRSFSVDWYELDPETHEWYLNFSFGPCYVDGELNSSYAIPYRIYLIESPEVEEEE